MAPRAATGPRATTEKAATQKAATQKAATQKAATPWGPASVVEEVTLRQRTGDKSFATVVQLLETAKGEQLVRFAYSTDGTARRGPVTLRGRYLESLRTALAKAPRLKEVLRLGS
jgi:hypothetical protein